MLYPIELGVQQVNAKLTKSQILENLPENGRAGYRASGRSLPDGELRFLTGLPARFVTCYLTRTSFMIRPSIFQSCTYKLPSASQYEP